MADISVRFSAGDERLRTAVGERRHDRIVVRGVRKGCALFGPYIQLPRGTFAASVHLAEGEAHRGEVELEVSIEGGVEVVASKRVSLSAVGPSRRVDIPFSLKRPASRCEVRLHCRGSVTAAIAAAEITYVDRDSAAIEAGLMGEPIRTFSEQAVFARFDVLERLVRGGQGLYVGDNRILMRAPMGEINLVYFMPADDRLLTPIDWAHGVHEPEVTRYFQTTVTSTAHCLDVGANFGYFTCLMGHLARKGKTIGVEPDPAIFALLRDNIYANSLGDLAVALLGAVGEQAGRMTLYRRSNRSGNTSLMQVSEAFTQHMGEAPAEPFESEVFSVDDLLPRFDGRIDVMKVDVEGAEPLVFRGMGKALAANPGMRIVMEWSPGQIRGAKFDVGGFLDELAGLGLQAAVVTSKGPVPISFADLAGAAYYSGVLLTKAA